jgi:hypothetical protein
MPIHFACPFCGAATEVGDRYAGQSGPCAACGKTITIPPLSGDMPMAGPQPKRGLSGGMLTLIIAVAIVPVVFVCGGILIALLLPAVQAAREAARRVACQNNLREIGLALHNYAQANNGYYPPAFIADKDGRPMHSWRVLILPYMEEEVLYKQYKFDEPWDGPHNRTLADRMPMPYRCPSDLPTGQTTSYVMMVGPHAFATGAAPRRMSEIKNLGNTIMVAEDSQDKIPWMEPKDFDTEAMNFFINRSNSFNVQRPQSPDSGISSPHPGGANVLYCNSMVDFLNSSISTQELRGKIILDEENTIPSIDFQLP